MVTTQTELYGFALAFVAGIAIGVVFELVSVGRRVYPGRPIVCFLIDVMGIVCIAALLAATILFAATGLMRLYVFTGILLGAGFYRVTFGAVLEAVIRSRKRGLLLRITKTFLSRRLMLQSSGSEQENPDQ